MAYSTSQTHVTRFEGATAVDALIGLDRRGRVTVWNDAAARLFGHAANDIIGRSYIALVPPRFRPSHEQGMRTRGSRPPEALMGAPRRWIGLRKSGDEFPFEMSIRWWDVDEGTCIVGSIVELREGSDSVVPNASMGLLNYDTTIAEAIPQLVWLSNAPGRLEYCNHRWYEYFGLRRADLEVIAEHKILHPEDRRAWIAKWIQALASEQPFEHECRLRRSDGEYRWFLSRSIPLRDGAGKLQRWFGTSTDIHDQKLAQAFVAAERDELESLVARRTSELQETVEALEAEALANQQSQKQLQDSEWRLQSALDGARDVVWDYDCLTRVVYRSNGWSTMLGYGDIPFDSSIEHWHEIAHPEDQKVAFARFQDFVHGKRDYHDAEYRLRDASGAWRWISSKGKVTERASDGTPLRVAGTSADITDRKEAEEALRAAKNEAERASKAKSEFLANMSHELRTPLNSVIGFANVLRKNRLGQLSSIDLTYLDRIRANGVHLLRLIDDVLDVAKIEAGKMEIEMSTVRLDEMMRDLVAQTEGQTREGVQMNLQLPFGTIYVRADELRLRQVVLNQLSNAIKFTESGSITAAVVCNSANEPQRIEIRDTGIGVSPERVAAIFNSFEQADTGTARLYGGTGLGLAISRSLCEQMGFTLTMASEIGVGSTFTITLALGTPRRRATDTL